MFIDRFLGLLLLSRLALGLPLGGGSKRRERDDERTKRKLTFEIPLQRRGSTFGSVGLGDSSDLLYTVPIELGTTTAAVNLDTGSSDLWVISDACNTDICNNATATRYPTTSFTPSGVSVTMNYGDSKTGTSASGPVGVDVATIAGVAISQQPFVAVNSTTNTLVQQGASGILGLGFPSGSVIQSALSGTSGTDGFVSSTSTNGPLLSRMVMSGALENPLFAVTLQRNTIDIGGKGQLTIGKLPDGVDNSSLTWVPVRLYTPDEGGQQPPTFAPNEVYPFRWEIEIDAVFLDGKQLANSAIPPKGVSSTKISALIDTGNSLIRGPNDVVQNILTTVSPSYNPASPNSLPVLPCNVPHTLSFQIGGRQFPVDPRDFIQPDIVQGNCLAGNVVTTDPPSKGALFSWNLGDPFFKSNVIAFHYGNLTNPSVDPPRIGLLSTMPSNAGSLLQTAVQDAVQTGGRFESTLDVAPTAAGNNEATSTIVISTTASTARSSPTVVPPNQRINAASSIRMDSLSVFIATLVPLVLSGFVNDIFREFQMHKSDGRRWKI